MVRPDVAGALGDGDFERLSRVFPDSVWSTFGALCALVRVVFVMHSFERDATIVGRLAMHAIG